MTVHDRLPILVAVGDSDTHDAALRFAAEQALREHRPLRLVHVLPPTSGGLFPEQTLVSFEAAMLAAQQLLTGRLEHAQDLVHGRVAVEKTLSRAPVVEHLLELSLAADRIVLQHRQQTRLRRVFTGSVCAGIASRAAVPVVSVPELWSPSQEPEEVLVGLDGVGDHRALLAHAFGEADRRNAAVRVVHAWFVPVDVRRRDRRPGRPCTSGRSPRAGSSTSSCAVPPGAPQRGRADRRPAHAAGRRPRRALRAQHPAGRRAPRARARRCTHLGSVTRAVIRESRCPVTIVAPADVATSGRDQVAVEEPVMSS